VRTRDELIDLLWPDRFLSDSRTLDTHIHRLRAKLEPDPADPRFIVTVRGVGFRIEPDGDDPVPPTQTGPGPDPSTESQGAARPVGPHPASDGLTDLPSRTGRSRSRGCAGRWVR
jgi:DNA-binding winged helix-turn-helix (wHTH) protein